MILTTFTNDFYEFVLEHEVVLEYVGEQRRLFTGLGNC